MLTGVQFKVMYEGTFAPWEFYPKFLYFNEIQNPLKVLDDFFSSDWLECHQKELKEWRDAVIAEDYYSHPKFGPSSLLFQYNLNVRLLEAMYLLGIKYEQDWPRYKPLSDEELSLQQAAWDYPDNLSDEELKNPYLVIEKVFKTYSLPQYRSIFEEWLYYALSAKTNEEEIRNNELLPVYENMLLIYAAAWLIHKRAEKASGERKSLRSKKEVANEKEIAPIQPVVLKEPIKDILPNLTAAQKLGLEEVVSVITKRVESVESITLLGTHPDPFTFYLVILLNDYDKLVEHEVAGRIEDIVRPLISVITIVHKSNSARSGINTGNRFWNHTFSKGLKVFSVPEFTLPEFQLLEAEVYKDKVRTDWERWGGQGKAFLRGAHYYLGIENYTLALFSLHQAAESTLIGSIKCVLGYRFSVHNLLRIIRITQLFTDELKDAIGMDKPENMQLLNLLQVAYSETRYRGSFIANKTAVEQLVPIVESLLGTAQAVYEKFVDDDH